jgi:hypothetical protein
MYSVSDAFPNVLRASFTSILSYTTVTAGYPSSRLDVCSLTGLRIRARILAIHFVLLNPAMRLLVRAGCVAHSKHSERVRRSVLLDEILCNLNLSTDYWAWTMAERGADTYNVTNEAVQESLREILFYNDTQNIDLA